MPEVRFCWLHFDQYIQHCLPYPAPANSIRSQLWSQAMRITSLLFSLSILSVSSVQAAPPGSGWSNCAGENQSCNFNGQREVATASVRTTDIRYRVMECPVPTQYSVIQLAARENSAGYARYQQQTTYQLMPPIQDNLSRLWVGIWNAQPIF